MDPTSESFPIGGSSKQRQQENKKKKTIEGAEKAARTRAPNWSNKQTSTLVELIREQQINHNAPSNGQFGTEYWNKWAVLLNARSTPSCTPNELYVRYRTLKATYSELKRLASKSRWGWNPDKCVPRAPCDECWKEVNLDMRKYQHKGFPWYDTMSKICGSTIARGNRARSGFQQQPLNVDSDSDSSDDVEDEQCKPTGITTQQSNLTNFTATATVQPPLYSNARTTPALYSVDDDGTQATQELNNFTFEGFHQEFELFPNTNCSSAHTEPSVGMSFGNATSSGKRVIDDSMVETSDKTKSSTSKRRKTKGSDHDSDVEKIYELEKERLGLLKEISNNTKKGTEGHDAIAVARKLKAIKSEFNLTAKDVNDLRIVLRAEYDRGFFMEFEGEDLRDLISDMLERFRLEH